MGIMSIPYTGNRKDLKKMGYTFRKVWANNYQMYEKHLGNTQWGRDRISVWVKGKTIEIADHGKHTRQVVEFFIKQIEDFKKMLDANPKRPRVMVICVDDDDKLSIETYEDFITHKQYQRKIHIDVDIFPLLIEEIKRINKPSE